MYRNFLRTDPARWSIPNFGEELDHAQQCIAENDGNDDVPVSCSSEQDDWMLCCSLNHRYAVDTNSGTDSFNWPAFARSLSPNLIKECPSWIKFAHCGLSCLEGLVKMTPTHRGIVSYLQLMSPALMLNKIWQHYLQVMQKQHPSPLHMIVCGTVGIGKSYLISAISQALGQACILTGTTGMASYNICGKTLHSTLQLPIKTATHVQQDLQGSALQRLQLTMKDKSYLIIDEMSMMGQRMLAWVDRRLRQATAKLDQPLGGVSVILFADFAQLPPVCDSPLYAAPSTNPLSVHGYTIYHTFSTVLVLRQIVRQAGTDSSTCTFRELLLRLRDGNISHDDWQPLLKCSPPHADNLQEFDNAVHLFYETKCCKIQL